MKSLSRNAIVTVSIGLEASLLLLAAIWMLCANIELMAKFQFAPVPIAWGLAAALASTTVSIICVTIGKNLPLLADLRKMSDELLAPLLSKLSPSDIVFLSLTSGFCEEVLFRGIIQAQCGLWITSIVFGVFHDPTFKQRSYVVLAALAGLGLGYLYQQTGNLWSCICAHIIHNLFAMLALRYWIKPSAAA